MKTHKNIIVTLQYNKCELTERFLRGVLDNEYRNIDRILVVDNGSDAPFGNRAGIAQYAIGDFHAFIVDTERLDENMGFTLGANYGLRKACKVADEEDLIFLISNDVEINGKFIEQAESAVFKNNPALVGNRHINWDSGWNTFDGKTFDYLEGYFLVTTKWGWVELGMFDPHYAPFDYEDVDLSTKAKEKGYKLVSLNNPNIVHQGGGTLGYNSEREAITRHNQEYFKNKWFR